MLHIPGVLHINHNIIADLRSHLHHYDDFVKSSKQVIAFFKKWPSRESFINACLTKPPASSCRRMFEEGCPAKAVPHDKRFETVTDAIAEALAMQAPLKMYWDIKKISEQGSSGDAGEAQILVEGEGGTEFGTLLEAVDAHINSPFFWAACRVYLAMHLTVDHITHLAESCPCHPGRMDADVRQSELGGGRCAAMGCQSATFDGAAVNIVEEHLGRSRAEIMLMCRHLVKDQVTSILGGWDGGSSYIACAVQAKYSCWTKLLHSLCIAAHPDQSKARAGLERAYAEYDAAVSGGDGRHHRMAMRFCEPGSTLREQAGFIRSKSCPSTSLPTIIPPSSPPSSSPASQPSASPP